MRKAQKVPDFIEITRDPPIQEADRFNDGIHPREMLWFGGHQEQERVLLDAYRSGKLHHAWLLSGPEGVGKATLAYRFARFLLANPDPVETGVKNAADLSVRADHPIAGQVARLSHPDLGVIRRGLTKDGKSLRLETVIEVVRDGLAIFRTTAGSGGWRIIIVDSADDLNRSSANALLKMLEEPPARAIFLLVSQRPGTLLPTIRSRCRVLRFNALPDDVVADGLRRLSEAGQPMLGDAVAGAEGSLRQALALLDPGEAALRRDIGKALARITQESGKALMRIIDKTAGRAGEKAFATVLELIERHLRAGLHDAGPKTVLAARAELWEKLRRTARDVEDYNLDRRPFLLSIFSELAEIERRVSR
jgi:DNA polymerase III subunit delta'